MEANRMYIPAFVRGKDFTDDQREFDFVITTDKRDSYGTIFTSEGWSFERYLQNPVVFYQHRSHGDDPDNLIGITVKGPWKETLDDGSQAWVARVRFENESVNPKAEKIRKKVIAGTLRMASIGCDVLDYRWSDTSKGEPQDTIIFTRQDLFEWSVVNIGSNPSANVKRNEEVISQIRMALDPEQKKPTPGEGSENNELSLYEARLAINKRKMQL